MWAVVDYYSQWLSRIQLHRSADEEMQIAEICQNFGFCESPFGLGE